MVNIIGLQEVLSYFGENLRMKFTGQVDLVEGETITQGSATAIVVRQEESNLAVVSPNSDEYFVSGTSFTTSNSDENGTLTMLPCQLTAIKLFHDAAQQFIRDYTGVLYGDTESRTVKPPVYKGMRYHNFTNKPVNSVTSVTYNGSTLTAGSDYYFKRNRYLDFGEFGLNEPNDPNALEIVYVHGQTSIPETIKHAARLYITHMWQMRNRNVTTKGANTLSFGGRTINWALNPQPTEIEGIIPELSQILKKKSIVRVG